MRLTLGKKLGLGFAVILALMVFSTTMSYLKSASITQSQDITFELRYPTLETVRRLQRDVNQVQSQGRQVVLGSRIGQERGSEEVVRRNLERHRKRGCPVGRIRAQVESASEP
jgi:CHASE3 domain sensor protein